ncbi:MAG: transposase [Cytophagales bacterium]|nr:transposase [Cytophagales bacterium]
MRERCIFFLCWLLFSPTGSTAARLVEITDQENRYFISLDLIDILVDEGKKWTIDQVSAPPLGKKFVPNRENEPAGEPNSAYWVRFTVTNHSQRKNFILHVFSHNADKVTLYSPLNSGKFRETVLGSVYPYYSNVYPSLGFSFDLDLPVRPQTYYLRYESSIRINLTAEIQAFPSFTAFMNNTYYYLGLLYGLIVAIAIYNLFTYFALKEVQYLHYVCYLFSVLFYIMSLDGTAFQYLWPNHPAWNSVAVPFSSTCLVIWLLVFARSFLLTRAFTPRFDKILLGCIGGKIGLFLLNVWLQPNFPYFLSFDIVPFLLAYVAGILCFARGYKPARYYLASFTFLLIGYLVMVLKFLQWLPLTHWGYSGLRIGLIGESLLLSLALADRIKSFKADRERVQQQLIRQLQEKELLKERINQELEKEVNQRTEQLRLQTQEVIRLNALLQADKKELEHNLEDVSKARAMQKHLSFEEFQQTYPDEEACYAFLAQLKWEQGFACKKCGNETFTFGNSPHSRKCTRCKHIESVTAGTILNKLKFPVVKAFYMLYLVSNGKSTTARELSEILSLRLQTCWTFRERVKKAMQEKPVRKHQDGWSHLILSRDQEPTPGKATLAPHKDPV